MKQGLLKRDTSWPLQVALKVRLDSLALLTDEAVPRPVAVLDFAGVQKLTPFPYVTIGDETTERNLDNKNVAADSVTVQLHLWSQYPGGKEVAYLGDLIEKGLTATPLDLGASLFRVNAFRREFAQTFKEIDGITLHRVLRFRAWVEDLTPQSNP